MSRRRKTEAHAETRRRGVNKGGHSCPPNGGLGNSPAGENFVQTELGRLPADWSALPIRDVGEVITGRTPSTKREDFYNGEYNLISPADLDNGKYVVTAHKRLSEVGFKEYRALPKDSVLVGCIGNVGKLGMISDERSATNQQINAVICDKNHDSHFIYYCLHENRARLEWAADKTTLPILNKTNFENFEIATPPLPEQRKIAAVLGMVQRALEQQERLIALTTELKRRSCTSSSPKACAANPKSKPKSARCRRVGRWCRSIRFVLSPCGTDIRRKLQTARREFGP